MVDRRLLDELAANATAPSSVRNLGSWVLRADAGLPFRRSNATLPIGGDPAAFDVDARVELVEGFYRELGVPPRFQIAHETDPSDLDERLARRGYVVDAPVDILTADASRVVCGLAEVESASARVETAIDPRWADGFADDPGVRRRIDGYARLFAGIVPRHVVVMVDLDDAPGALGLGVIERGWVGIFGMVTRRAVRRRGAARVVLGTLARWADDQGAANLYLQVEADNDAARGLYESAGFVFSHSYHYRVLL